MKPRELIFRLVDKLNNEPINPSNISVALLEEYAAQVSSFVKGAQGHIKTTEIKARVEDGSFAVAVEDETGILDEVFHDYGLLIKDEWDDVDRKRSEIFSYWQESAKKATSRSYELVNSETGQSIIISASSSFQRPAQSWVNVEEYRYGRIFDLGGKTKPNVHLLLAGGDTLKVGASTDMLVSDQENRLYKNQLVRFKAKRNLSTGEIVDQELLSFEKYNPHYDEEEFAELVAEGTKAWSGISNASNWVEEIRGNA